MDYNTEYERIRPYNDSEVPSAIKRIISEENFKHVVSYLYGYDKLEESLNNFTNIKTVKDFQLSFSHFAVREVVRKASAGLTYGGLNNLDPDKGYLFIANHRDIVLDSAIMQILLVENNHKTSQITFGSNLMSNEFIIDLGKLNKMFTFERGGSKIQMYKSALLHSQYLKKVITEENESIWIAQRDGRTKDGNDKTQASLIKMLTMGKENPFEALRELNIVPVTISYEYEPCDAQKVQELYISQKTEYIKQPGEDLNSVLNGIKNYKGKIHMEFGTPINSVLDLYERDNLSLNELADNVAKEIDRQVYLNFKLQPVNYISNDIINEEYIFLKHKYNEKEKEDFVSYVQKKVALLNGDREKLTNMFYELYSKPVENNLKVKE